MFVVLHGGSLLLDRVVPISLGQLLVPFTSPYRPLAVGLGVTAAELMAAVGVTNLLRGRMPRTVWRRVHYLTLAVWALASLHGVLAGSDRADPWFAGIVRRRRPPSRSPSPCGCEARSRPPQHA